MYCLVVDELRTEFRLGGPTGEYIYRVLGGTYFRDILQI